MFRSEILQRSHDLPSGKFSIEMNMPANDAPLLVMEAQFVRAKTIATKNEASSFFVTVVCTLMDDIYMPSAIYSLTSKR